MMLRRYFPLVLLALAAPAQVGRRPARDLAPFVPTPEAVVERMLRLVDLKPGEKLFDLGSGDGRIVIMAAQRFGADATGVELDYGRWKLSMERIAALGLESRARIIHGDALSQDYRSADVITVYLLPRSNDLLRPILERQLKPGARVVSHDFEFAGWRPERVEWIPNDGEGRSHKLFLYRR